MNKTLKMLDMFDALFFFTLQVLRCAQSSTGGAMKTASAKLFLEAKKNCFSWLFCSLTSYKL